MADAEKKSGALTHEPDELRQRVREPEARVAQNRDVLRENQAAGHIILDIPTDSTALINTSGTILHVNETMARSFDREAGELIGLCIWDLFPPKVAERSRAHTEQAIRTGQAVRFYDERDGTYFDSSVHPILDRGGTVAAVAVVARDITEWRRTEHDLEESRAQYRAILQNAPLGYYRVGKDGRWQDVNVEWERMHGYSREEVIGKSYQITQPKELNGIAREHVKRALSGETIAGEFARKRKDGSLAFHTFSIQPVYREGEIIAVEGFINDITDRKRAEEALRESEAFSSSLLNDSPIPTLVVNPDTSIRYVNPALEQLTGFGSEELLGTKAPYPWWTEETRFAWSYASRWHPYPWLAEETRLKGHGDRKGAAQKGTGKREGLFQKKSGEAFWVEVTATRMNNQHTPSYQLENWIDITERKRTDRALKESENHYRSLFDNASDGILVHDPEGNILMANKAMEQLTGYRTSSLCSMNISGFLSPSSYRAMREKQRKWIKDGGGGKPIVGRYELEMVTMHGRERTIEVVASLLPDPEQRPIIQTLVRDITEQKRAQENIRTYARQVTDAQEKERNRIARELHDETAQALASLGMDIDSLAKSSTMIPAEVSRRLEELRNRTSDILQGVRCLSRDLRPPLLESLGLLPSLRWLVDDLIDQHRIEATLAIQGAPGRLLPDAELALFRIVQEATNNVKRHSDATEVLLQIDFAPERVRVLVRDNGKGFHVPEAIGELASSGKLGLMGMQERAWLQGGVLTVEAMPGEGTRVEIELPRQEPGTTS